MFQETELNTVSAGQFAAKAAYRAQMYSQECASRWSSIQRSTAETFADLLRMAYTGTKYVTFRKTFVTVKIGNATVRDRAMVKEINAIIEERGYEKVRTAQGIEVRLFAK